MNQKIENIALIEPRAPDLHEFSKVNLPRLGLPILGSILDKLGKEVKVFCEEIRGFDWDQLLDVELVGISSLTSTAPRAYEIAKRIKEEAKRRGKEISIVMGGPHFSFLPEEALKNGADFVIRGEGEQVFPRLIKSLESGKGIKEIAGLSYQAKNGSFKHNDQGSLVEDLDHLPRPDLSLIEGSEDLKMIPIQTTRGCPYDCEFCAVVQMFGHQYRQRSLEKVLADLSYYHEKHPDLPVFFYDDNFTANTERTKTLLREMKRRNIVPPEWSAQARISVAENEELLSLMENTGCNRVYIGIESINPTTLEEYNKQQNLKQIEKGLDKIHNHGIAIHGMFVLGGETDTPDTIRETTEFALDKGIDTAQFLALTPIPGTETFRKLRQAGRILMDQVQDWQYFDGHHVVFEPHSMSPVELQRALIRANSKFYSWGRALKWAFKGKLTNSMFAFYGRRIVNKWKKHNQNYMTNLKLDTTSQ